MNSRLLSWETTPSTEKWWREAHFLLLFSFSPELPPIFPSNSREAKGGTWKEEGGFDRLSTGDFRQGR